MFSGEVTQAVVWHHRALATKLMKQVQNVPFLDLNSQIEPIRNDLFEIIESTIDASDFVLGPRLEAFEQAFADYCGCSHAIGVSSGTPAQDMECAQAGIDHFLSTIS